MNLKRILFHKATIITVLVIVFGALSFYGIRILQQNRDHHDRFIGDIEELYYFLKKEPVNMETYGILREGDSVALSAWQNILSTQDTRVKQYERMIVEHAADNSHYKEIEMLEKLGEGLKIFNEIRMESRERVESQPGYHLEEYEEIKSKLQALLQEVQEMGKKHRLDLR